MKITFIVIFTFLFLLFANILYALDSLEILSGYLVEEMKYEKDSKGVPLLVSLGFDGRPLFSKIGINTKGRIDFIIEPFINTIFEPKNNVEGGANFLVKYVFPLSERFQPYFKGGLGALYMSQHVAEQGTQYNFLPQGALGFHFFVKENVAITCEYRHRHLSNAGFKKPNKGIDAKLYLGGISFFFK